MCAALTGHHASPGHRVTGHQSVLSTQYLSSQSLPLSTQKLAVLIPGLTSTSFLYRFSPPSVFRNPNPSIPVPFPIPPPPDLLLFTPFEPQLPSIRLPSAWKKLRALYGKVLFISRSPCHAWPTAHHARQQACIPSSTRAWTPSISMRKRGAYGSTFIVRVSAFVPL
jgi:hypothetical protein